MTPSPDALVKVTGYAMSSDDEISRINLVKIADPLTEAPQRRAIRRNSDLNRQESETSSVVTKIRENDVQSDAESTSSEDMGPYAPINDPIRPGDKVLVKGKYKGICRYVGPIQEKRVSDERFVGVQLEEKMTRFSGVFGTKQYFDCPYGYGLMVTFKNVRKFKEAPKRAKIVEPKFEIPAWEKTTTIRTVSRSTDSGLVRRGSDETNSSFGLSLPSAFLYRENKKGWRVSPGFDEMAKTKSRSSIGSLKSRDAKSDIFDKQGTMEILDMYKNMQHSFRSLPVDIHEEKEYFNPGRFYKFKPFYYHSDLGPMRANLGEKNISVDCPNPEWDQMRQSFQMIVRENQVHPQEVPQSEYHDPMMDRYYFPCNSEGFLTSGRVSSRDSFESHESVEEPIRKKSSRMSSRRCSSLGRMVERVGGLKEIKCPKIQPIRVRKYFEKESDSSGIYDSDGSIDKNKKTSRRNSKTIHHQRKSYVQKVCGRNCPNSRISQIRDNESRSASPILQSFRILNNDTCVTMCDNCGEQKLNSLGQIPRRRKEKKIEALIRETSDLSVEPKSSKFESIEYKTISLKSADSMKSADSLFDERPKKKMVELKRSPSSGSRSPSSEDENNEIKAVSDLVVAAPNICEKWAEKHGQELANGMARGMAKLSMAVEA